MNKFLCILTFKEDNLCITINVWFCTFIWNQDKTKNALLTGSRIGRQPNAVKYHCALEIKNYQNVGSSPNSGQASNQSFDNCYSGPIDDPKNQSIIICNPPNPLNADFSMTFSLFLDSDSQAFFLKASEAIDILQTPISVSVIINSNFWDWSLNSLQ